MRGKKFLMSKVPAQGSDVVFDDPQLWEGPIAEFHMGIRIVEPLRAKVFILPGDEGCLLRGKLSGKVGMHCDRCAEEAVITLAHEFDNFESMPRMVSEGKFVSDDDSGLISVEDGQIVLDAAALCWEEFILALPVKPLCENGCQGICPGCGENLNSNSCKCRGKEEDPRLAPLRSVVVRPANKKHPED